MKLYKKEPSYTIYEGSMLDMAERISPNSIDSIVTDPPYELNFMHRGWDNAGVSFSPDTWRKCFDALKPGGYLVAFGGSRTYHRIACAIEDAGFEIRDCIMWLYGSGFPKSMNIGLAIDKKLGVESKIIGQSDRGKATNSGSGIYACNNGKDDSMKKVFDVKEAQNEWAGWGTALKPAYEPIILARKPFEGSLVDNVLENGVGGINIDECRVEAIDQEEFEKNWDRNQSESSNVVNYVAQSGCDLREYKPQGRFPANVIHDGSEEVVADMPSTSSGSKLRKGSVRKNSEDNLYGLGFANNRKVLDTPDCYGDSGSVARYFYCTKASKRDRDEGLDNFEEKEGGSLNCRVDGSFAGDLPKRKNTHPTVKPTSLMQYLVRLVTPKGGIILDPFMGSGSTGKATMFENQDREADYKFIGIEMTSEYLPIALARIEFGRNNGNK